MKFSYRWLKELVTFKESPQKLAEVLTLRAFEVESVITQEKDHALDVKVTPNRVADASGHEGLAREIAGIKGIGFRVKGKGLKETRNQNTKDVIQIKIENSADCPRYTARVMTGIKIGQSPKWLRQRLETCGLQSINNVVDAANYVMLETGQPLHIFDFAKLSPTLTLPLLKGEGIGADSFPLSKRGKVRMGESKKIIIRRARMGEKLLALDDKIYELNPEILVIADEKEPIAIAGIKGGKESGVSENTTTIILESANFNPSVIRRGSRSLGIGTDASYRFEHGLDPNETIRAIDRLAAAIQDLCGGTALKGYTDAYPRPGVQPQILFRPAYANRLIGEELSALFYQKTFERIGCRVEKTKKGTLLVRPPSIRRDLLIEEDLIEEAARLFGYEKISSRRSRGTLTPAAKNDEWFWEERVRDILAGAGFIEHLPYEFTGDDELGAYGGGRENSIEIANPASPEQKYLLPRAPIKFIAAASQNERQGQAARIFGIAKEFAYGDGGKKMPTVEEQKTCAAVIAQRGGNNEELFYEMKGVVDHLLESLGISDHSYKETRYTLHVTRSKLFHPYRFAEIKIGDEKIGNVGEINPAILKTIKAQSRIAAAEIDFDKLWRLARDEQEFKPIGKFPAVIRDIAVIVPAGTTTEELSNIIEGVGGPLLIDTDLFDYFEDDRMREADQKSMAFHLVFQSAERTLTDKEVDAIMTAITAAVEQKGWEVRK